ncbi:hypothetical protein SAMN02927921_04237 [Sinomicrobium oceani]|uniref:Uncharacterized protein n=1 Tax=Sinomicrobium oceani TaxID=1150368 RepID=A0A1K1RZD3_9FLAO|nr:hypothetical protein [Sinomicrobium oceani]SFW77491.1 hypothetical protein SAMN02927921_04237 [Sinomicrobium oceani]
MEENKSRFKLSRANWIFAGIVIGISALIFLRNDGINAYSLGHLLGSIVTVGLIPLIFAFLVWLIRRRKAYAGTYTFNFVLVLMCFGMIKEIGAIRKEKTESMNNMTRSLSEYKEKISNEEDAISAYEEFSSNVDESLSKLIQNSSGNEQEVYRKLQKFVTLNKEQMTNWEKSYDSVMTPRILDFSVLNTPEEYNYQIAVIEHYQNQSEVYKQYFTNRKSLVSELFKNIPKDNQTLKGVVKGINKKDSIQRPVFIPLMDTHISYSRNLIDLLALLKEYDGTWEYQNDELIFENEKMEQRYLAIIQKVAENEDQINELTDKLIEMM